MIRNGFAILGVVFIILLIWMIFSVQPTYTRFNSFDDKALETYQALFKNILATGNAAEATVWKVKVEEGLKASEVEETMKFVANEHNIKNVGELPLYKQVEASTGKPFRFMKIYMFCNAVTASKMVEYSDAFSAYLPCRVTLLEDKQGQLWLYSLNMDLMIHGGTPLPPKLKKEALGVKKIILDIMNRGASGEF